MDYERIAENVTMRVAGRGEEYRKYFDKMLKKWKVKSPAEIPDDKKDDFFEEVDKGWNSADESGKDGKKASELISLRDRRAGCEKLPEGPMRDNCEKKKGVPKQDGTGPHGKGDGPGGGKADGSGKKESSEKEAGCEKLPEGPMRDNCEKKKKDGDKKEDKDK